jgi:hypothetical protein
MDGFPTYKEHVSNFPVLHIYPATIETPVMTYEVICRYTKVMRSFVDLSTSFHRQLDCICVMGSRPSPTPEMSNTSKVKLLYLGE